ncbi:MAG: HPr family phosphocarrier protein, partial [Candidatus Lindowbacteria bacterium]|nr:HPr family phosphocarrier protein [Candidatus Lindowbacteria bacterium]
QGSTITIEIEGDDAEDAMKGLAELINRKFDEE